LIRFENGVAEIIGKYFGDVFFALNFDFPSHMRSPLVRVFTFVSCDSLSRVVMASVPTPARGEPTTYYVMPSEPVGPRWRHWRDTQRQDEKIGPIMWKLKGGWAKANISARSKRRIVSGLRLWRSSSSL
jgi:hypothetical protein